MRRRIHVGWSDSTCNEHYVSHKLGGYYHPSFLELMSPILCTHPPPERIPETLSARVPLYLSLHKLH
jgi:hypothetical protein